MDENANPTAERVYVYTIAPLQGVTDEEFERGMSEEVLPRFFPATRVTMSLKSDTYLLKSDQAHRADKYIWHIRMLEIALMDGHDIEQYGHSLDSHVRSALAHWGLPISLTVLHEVANVRRE